MNIDARTTSKAVMVALVHDVNVVSAKKARRMGQLILMPCVQLLALMLMLFFVTFLHGSHSYLSLTGHVLRKTQRMVKNTKTNVASILNWSLQP